MKTSVHVLNVDQGNMVLIETATGPVFLCDCNVTASNESRILPYLRHVLRGRRISGFINTHRDADHMRGINRVHRAVGIDRVFDSGLSGGDLYSPEYTEYMRMRREVPSQLLVPFDFGNFGPTYIRVLSAACDDLPDECNSQSLVLKVQHGSSSQNSIILTGDSDSATWKKIRERFTDAYLSSEILLASHHGSWSFFECDREGWLYAAHIRAINPAMTVVSVGNNPHGHPHPDSVSEYERFSRGSAEGHRLWRTDLDGTMRLELSDAPWVLWRGQTALAPVFRPAPRPQLPEFPPRYDGGVAQSDWPFDPSSRSPYLDLLLGRSS